MTLSKDPDEINDIASTDKGQSLIKKLFPQLLNLQKKMGDTLDLQKSFPTLSSE